MTPTRALRIWERDKGICCLCGHPIDGVRQKWIIEHKTALALGGKDEDANCGPAHKDCADEKTHGPDGDLAKAAEAKRVKRKHLGIRKSKSPMPCGRGSGWKRTMDGKTVRRDG
jgi:5-methylcytosine-specific restriction protein A